MSLQFGPKARLQNQGASPPLPLTVTDTSGPLRPVRQSGGIEVAASLLLTTLATAAVVMREPLYHSLPKQPAPFEYRVPNLLTGTLGPVAPVSPGMPPQPLESGVPNANTWILNEPVLNLLETTLKPVIAQPFNVDDLGVPLAVQPAQNWQPQRNLLLTAVPFRPTDQTALQAQRGQFSFEPQNRIILASVAVAAPFVPVDFSNLLQPGRLLVDSIAGVNLALFTTPQPEPFAQLDWPALQLTQLQPQYPAGANVVLFTTPQPQPFNQLDWPALAKTVSPEPHQIPNTTINPGGPPVPPVPDQFAVTPGKLPPWPWSWTHSPSQKADSPEYIRSVQRAMLREQELRAEKRRLEKEFSIAKLAAASIPAAQQKSALQNREYAILRRKIRSVEESLSQAVTKEIELRLRAVEHETAQNEAVAARRKRELMMVLLLA